MAIDFLIFGLLLISFVINLLALVAFWITPGLRTTANRFTINLLIINLIGCLILAPTLFLTSAAIDRQQQEKQKDQLSPLQQEQENQQNHQQQQPQQSFEVASSESIEFYSKPGNHQMIIRHNGQVVEEEGIIVRNNATQQQIQQQNNDVVETLYKCNSTYCKELIIDESGDTIVITELQEHAQHAELPITLSPFDEEQQQQQQQQHKQTHFEFHLVTPVNMRCWSIDMAAALGALAVLLVVGDTWCAVTDPLRYHSRISGVKAWVFIGLTWLMGILFGALSAFRTLDFETDAVFSRKRQHLAYSEAYFSLYSTNGIFDMTFACIYFVVIILLPFGFVCGMYWRIFSEARENGLRMRQNGSSPLLQSALNLTQQQQLQQQQQQQLNQQQQQQQHHQQQQQQLSHQYINSLCMHRNSISSQSSSQGYSGGLHMQIDQRKSSPSPASMRRDSAAKALLPTISDDGVSYSGDIQQETHLMTVPEQSQPHAFADRNQNILLTLQSASGEIKRNYSARQLPLLGNSSQDLADAERLRSIRQVHSTPNLQKYNEIRQDSISEETNCSAHLLGYTQIQHTQQQRQQYQAHARHQHYHSPHQQNRRHSHVLQIPGLHSSPKALGYMSSLRHRLSNASSLFKYREESRAARISILVVFMFLVSYLPYGFLVLLQSRMPAANFPSSSQLAIFMILLGNLTSPFIFAYRNKRVRRGVKRLFGLDAHTRSERSFHSQGGGSTCGRNRASPSNIKRNSSKISTYSLNSCKHITPQNSLVNNDIVPVTHVRPTLRPNSSCSTIINFMLTKHSSGNSNSNSNGNSSSNANDTMNINHAPKSVITKETEEQHQEQPLQQIGTATTIIATQKSTSTAATKSRNLFKLLFRSSQNLSRSVKSCAQGNQSGNVEPVEV